MIKKTESIGVIGGGSWGTALARLLALKGNRVQIYLRDSEQCSNINQEHLNKRYFPGQKLPETITASLDLESVVSTAAIILLAVPTNATRSIMKKIQPWLRDDQIIVSTAKGIEEETHFRNSQIISQFSNLPLAVLSGPSHAEEVINDLPTAVVIASRDREVARFLQETMISSTFRVYTNPDLIGVETGGAVKNIIAVAAGIVDGLGYGDNTRAALITRGLHEMSRFGLYLGGELLTFAGLTGMGDLVVTCTSNHSRNHRLGVKIGEGYTLKEALDEINQVVEGVRTTRAIYEWHLKEKLGLELPITYEIYQVLFHGKDPVKAVDDLMHRGAKYEIEEVVRNLDW